MKAERLEKSVNTKRDAYRKRISNYESVVEQIPALSLWNSTSVGKACLTIREQEDAKLSRYMSARYTMSAQ